MNKDYYKVLEIDRDASPEIIEKAYKTLAKKYHPDLQDATSKKSSEEKMKLINEAYSVLSNEQLKAEYDDVIENIYVSKEDYDILYSENQNLKKQLNNFDKVYNNNVNNNNSYSNSSNNSIQNDEIKRQKELQYNQEREYARQKAYHDAYVQDLRNRGYKIKYKKTWKDYLKNLISLSITFFVFFLIFQIPFVKNYFIELYYSNALIKIIVDAFNEIFMSLYKIVH